MNEEQLREYLALKGYNSRSCRFEVIADLFSVSPEEAKAIEKTTRYIRKIFPRDDNTHRLETEALEDLGYHAESISDRAEQLSII